MNCKRSHCIPIELLNCFPHKLIKMLVVGLVHSYNLASLAYGERDLYLLSNGISRRSIPANYEKSISIFRFV